MLRWHFNGLAKNISNLDTEVARCLYVGLSVYVCLSVGFSVCLSVLVHLDPVPGVASKKR